MSRRLNFVIVSDEFDDFDRLDLEGVDDTTDLRTRIFEVRREDFSRHSIVKHDLKLYKLEDRMEFSRQSLSKLKATTNMRLLDTNEMVHNVEAFGQVDMKMIHLLVKVQKPDSARPGKRTKYNGSSEIMGKETMSGSSRIQYKDIPERPTRALNQSGNTKLPDDHLLVKLWKRAWGKDNQVFEEVSSPVEVLDGDLLPGRPFLDATLCGRMLVRAEYKRLYKFTEDSFAESDDTAPAVVVIGQPGIGKSYWLNYALHCRLAKEHPTFLFKSGHFYLFSESGVDEIFENDCPFTIRLPNEERWCFVDSADAPDRPPIALTGVGSRGTNLVYVTSPNRRRWKKIQQTRLDYIVYMNPWTWEEVECVVNDRDKGQDNIKRQTNLTQALERFEKYGPIARICLECCDYRVDEYDAVIRDTVNSMKDMSDMMRIIDDAASLRMEGNECDSQKLPSKFCLIMRERVEPASFRIRLSITSKYIADLCAAKILEFQVDNRDGVLNTNTWEVFSSYPGIYGHGATNEIYKAFAHKSFGERIVLSLQSMFQLQHDRKNNYDALFSVFKNEGDSKMRRTFEVCRNDVQTVSLDFCPSDTLIIPGDVQEIKFEPDIYYILTPRNKHVDQVDIDSFFLHDGILYLLKMTVGGNHRDIDINSSSFLEFTAKLRDIPKVGEEGEEKWRFVFVIPGALERFRFSCLDLSVSGNVGSPSLYAAKFGT